MKLAPPNSPMICGENHANFWRSIFESEHLFGTSLLYFSLLHDKPLVFD